MALIGTKNNRELYINLLKPLIPNDIKLYVEPFGGEFGLYEIMPIKPQIAIYNDINNKLYNQAKYKYEYNPSIYCFNQDYKDIILEWDDKNTFFNCDPVYYNKFYYEYNFTENDHYELAEILKDIKGRFLLNYQDRPLMRKLYKQFNIYKYKGSNPIYLPEIAITNYI